MKRTRGLYYLLATFAVAPTLHAATVDLDPHAANNWEQYNLLTNSKPDSLAAAPGTGPSTATPLPSALPSGLAMIAGLTAYFKLRRKSRC